MQELKFDSNYLKSIGDRIIDLSSREKMIIANIKKEVNNLKEYGVDENNINDINNKIIEIENLLSKYEETGKMMNDLSSDLTDTIHENESSIN